MLNSEFKDVKINKGQEPSYLGVQNVRHEGGIDVDMETCINDINKACDIHDYSNAPRRTDLFDEGDYDVKLNEGDFTRR